MHAGSANHEELVHVKAKIVLVWHDECIIQLYLKVYLSYQNSCVLLLLELNASSVSIRELIFQHLVVSFERVGMNL